MQRKPTLRSVGFISFSIAIFLAILLILARAWPEMEATMYGFIKFDYPALPSLSCPVLMTSLDREPVTIRLHNPLDTTLTWYVKTQFSTELIIVSADERVELQPGETRTLSWEVGKENIDLNNFIFADVFTSPAAALKMTESTCGTLVLKLPIKGGPVIFYAILFLTALGACLGLWLWLRHCDMGDPAVVSQSWGMRFIALVIAVGVLASLLSWWFLAILTLALTLLVLIGFLLPRKV
jgi:hypothetical protein